MAIIQEEEVVKTISPVIFSVKDIVEIVAVLRGSRENAEVFAQEIIDHYSDSINKRTHHAGLEYIAALVYGRLSDWRE